MLFFGALFRLGFPLASRINRLTYNTSQLAGSFFNRHTVRLSNSPPIACMHTVSCSISLPSSGFFSPFLRSTCSLSVASQYLALPDGPGRFVQGFTCPALLGILLRFRHFRLPDCHRLWYTFSDVFSYCLPISSRVPRPLNNFRCPGLGCSPFTRRY